MGEKKNSANELKAYVLLSNSGRLLVGYRVCFMDAVDGNDMVGPLAETWRICLVQQSGWVIELPKDVSPFPIFMNMQAEDLMECLGEL